MNNIFRQQQQRQPQQDKYFILLASFYKEVLDKKNPLNSSSSSSISLSPCLYIEALKTLASIEKEFILFCLKTKLSSLRASPRARAKESMIKKLHWDSMEILYLIWLKRLEN